jgi:hypothetical protein
VLSTEEKKGKGGGYGILCLFKFREVWPFLRPWTAQRPLGPLFGGVSPVRLASPVFFFPALLSSKNRLRIASKRKDSEYCDGLKQSINQGTVRRKIPLVTVTTVTVFRGRRIRSIDLLVRVRPVQEGIVDLDGSDVFPGDERQLGDSDDGSTSNGEPGGA